ncbi:hypothetical protein [Saccharopolyspora spinosa]|uniref:hypothetical protein n=1 Tax=Saccharopolyspora spinosa TaxID=60894 RepID=UPI000237A527|nr:hypothetical protein [Saccharopolyspora spinosa]
MRSHRRPRRRAAAAWSGLHSTLVAGLLVGAIGMGAVPLVMSAESDYRPRCRGSCC